MIVLMDLVRDMRELNARELRSLGGVIDDTEGGYPIYARLGERRMREVPPIRYRVHVSNELARNPLYRQLAPILKEIREKLERGESIAMYLPDYERPGRDSRDAMLNHWDIRHIHLNSQSTLRPNGLVARSDFLLYFRRSGSDIYWIDIGRHDADESGKWLWTELLNIAQRNWPSTQYLARGLHMVDEPSLAGMKAGRKGNFNVLASYGGKMLMSATMGVMCDGVPTVLSMQYMRFTDDLRNIERAIRARPYEFGITPHLAYAHVVLEHWDETTILCREKRTNIQIPFHFEANMK